MTPADGTTAACSVLPASLGGFLDGTLTAADTGLIRAHLDACDRCWHAWNAYRWEKASRTALYRDLRAFLGTAFVHGLDSSRALAREWDEAAPQDAGEAAAFFRSSVSYLYNLAIWEASGNRPRYVAEAAPLLADLGAGSIIDYGSGIGSDTLALRRLGYTVAPCDYLSPSARFFQWRARRLGQDPAVREPGHIPAGTGADTLWIIDTLDHLPDPAASIGHLLADARTVICEQFDADRGHGRQGFHYRRPARETAALFTAHGFRLVRSGPVIQCWHKPARTAVRGAATGEESGR